MNWRRAMTTNKQFVAFLLVVFVAMAVFPGSPARRFLAAEPEPAPPPPPPPRISEPVRDVLQRLEAVASGSTVPPPAPAVDEGGDLGVPAADPPEPEPPCDTDALIAALTDVRSGLAGVLGMPVPGDSLEGLVEIATGCSDEEPSTAVLDVALDLATLVPDPGLEIIDLPSLPPFPELPIQPVADALGPLRDTIREGCAQLATVALVLVVLPTAFHLPVSQNDLIQFLAPASSFCSLFDEAGAS